MTALGSCYQVVHLEVADAANDDAAASGAAVTPPNPVTMFRLNTVVLPPIGASKTVVLRLCRWR